MSVFIKGGFIMNKTKLSTLIITLLTMSSLAGCQWGSNGSSSNSGSSDTSINSSNSAGQSSSGNTSSSGTAVTELTGITLNKTELNILNGSSETLTVTFTPANATDKEVVWTSEDDTIATVANGVVTAKKVGSTTIKVASKNKSSIFATCAVTVKDNVYLSSVSAKHEFVLFEQNRNKDATKDDGFLDHEQSYKVGDDNAFNVKPELTVLDGKTFQPVSASRWLYDFNISAKLGEQTVGSEYFSVVDAKECNVKFTEAAVGKTFTISIAPNGVDASRVAALTKSLTVDVIDGYNVYNAKELGYFDTREADSQIDAKMTEYDTLWTCKWTEFKTANNMDINYHPASLVFHNDIEVTVEDLPSCFFYTKEQATALSDSKAEGSLMDYTFLYERTISGDSVVEGNYFALDLSKIPLIKRERYKTTEVGNVVGHSAAFKAVAANSNITFRNLNMTGNAPKAKDDNDTVYGGGIIFAKGAGCTSMNSYNIIATKFYITFFSDKILDDGSVPTEAYTVFGLDKVKCFNNYCSFLYNWGATITASNSSFDSAGGPILIQDHIETDDYEAQNGLVVLGKAPTANFIDCSLKNYIVGSEAWFRQFNATAVMPQIKQLSDFFLATGLPKSLVTNEAHEGKLYQTLESQSYLNFIVINKSGSMEGMTTYPVCGTVNIVESNKATLFNYRQPNSDSVAQAYLAYAAASEADKPAAQQALIAEAAKKGVTFAPDYSDAEEKITAYMTALCTPHGVLRGLNKAGAPVFDLGEQFDLLAYDGKNNYLQAATTVATGGNEKYVPTANQIAALPNYATLYYNGMGLVMGLTPYSL